MRAKKQQTVWIHFRFAPEHHSLRQNSRPLSGKCVLSIYFILFLCKTLEVLLSGGNFRGGLGHITYSIILLILILMWQIDLVEDFVLQWEWLMKLCNCNKKKKPIWERYIVFLNKTLTIFVNWTNLWWKQSGTEYTQVNEWKNEWIKALELNYCSCVWMWAEKRRYLYIFWWHAMGKSSPDMATSYWLSAHVKDILDTPLLWHVAFGPQTAGSGFFSLEGEKETGN